MRKRYYAFIGGAGLLAVSLALAISSVVAAQTPSATPTPGKSGTPNKPGIQRGLGNRLGQRGVEDLRGRAGRGVGMEVLSVSGQTITAQTRGGIVQVNTDANTKFHLADRQASLTDVKAGATIRVRGNRDNNGNFTANDVTVVPPHAAGQVTAVDKNSLTIKRGNQTQVVQLTSDTTYYLKNQKADASVVQVGRNVEVAGNLGTNGNISAMVVRVQPQRVVGTVSSISGSAITLTRGNWTTTVTTDSKTVYLNGQNQAAASDIQTGKVIWVEGFKTPDGKFQATTIHLAPARPMAPQPAAPQPSTTPSMGS